MRTRRRLELLLEGLPCDHDPSDFYETPDQLLEPLLLCYESLVKEYLNYLPSFERVILFVAILMHELQCLQQSCGSGILADGRLADLIRRVATFGMILMKLDLRQVCESLNSVPKALKAISLHFTIVSFISFTRNLPDIRKHWMLLRNIQIWVYIASGMKKQSLNF